MTSIENQYISISSSQRTSDSKSSTQFTVDLPTVITGNRTVALENIILPNTFQSIIITTGVNDAIDFNQGSGTQTLIIPAGTYSASTLATQIQTLFNTSVGIPSTLNYTVTINTAGTTTITQNTPAAGQMFTVTTAVNDRIDFNDGSGVQFATIPAGTYSRTALATAVQSAMNSVTPTPPMPFTVTISAANKTTISQIPSAVQQVFTVIAAGGASAGQNNFIDFQMQGSAVSAAQIVGGTYSRPGLVAAVQTAMNAPASGPTPPANAFSVTMTTANKTTVAFQPGSSQQNFVVTSSNNNIDFDGGFGIQTATIPVGTYTRSAFVAAATNAMNGIAPVLSPSLPGFAVTMTTANKTTIARNIVANAAPSNVSLLWASGANNASSCAAVLGFTKTDVSGSSTYSSDLPVPNSNITINAGNDKLDFVDSFGVVKSITLTNQVATPPNIALDIINQFNGSTVVTNGPSDGWTASYSALKFTITHSITTANGSISVLLNSTSNPRTPATALGFPNLNVAGSDSYTGTTMINPLSTVTITAGVNDRLIFASSGTSGYQKTATIAAGAYTPTQAAAAVQTAFNSVTAPNSSGSSCFVVLYNTRTQFFTIARETSASLNTFSLFWASGPSTATNAANLLGYSTTDLSGATTYTGDLTANTQNFSLLFGSGAHMSTDAAALLGFSPVDDTGQSSYTGDLTATPTASSFSLLFGSGVNKSRSAAGLLGFSPDDLSGANTYTGDLTATPTALFSLLFGTGPNVSRSAGPTLGYTSADLTGATTYTSQLTAMYSPSRVFIQCPTLDINVRQTTEGTVFAWEIPVTSAFGSTVTTFVNAPPIKIVSKGPFSSLNFVLVQSNGAIISLGPTNWRFSIIVASP